MVRVCSYPGCFNQMKRQCGITHSVTFHKLPLRDPERLNLWLIALRKDLRTANVDSLRVCSEHFSADDFRTCKGRALLKSTAVPMVSQLRTEGISQHPAAAVTETANIETSFDDVPHSTPVKPKQPGDRPQHSHARLQLVLTSPETTKERTCPSTSGSYRAFPPTRLSQTDMQAQMAEERLEEGLDVSMTSIGVPLDPKDTSFALPSSTSTSTPTSEETEDLRTWDERKWLC
ncbi:peroxynitrite isomerase THAP4-like [Cyprinodon tularosa]|uniref:peroxynitrite isomerase THAP4-like n=1 Tax=Cyprinodon tularosa TaxID=77115 RepID=UPI0018E23D83|nr:peroxynitrite isomerase THAP4-like [Cyprinodon tularosa]